MNTQTKRLTNNPLSSAAIAGLITDLRAFAREHLPAAMIPSQFVLIDELPKLPNGKVDRKRLPATCNTESAGSKYKPPETAEEVWIAQLWRDLLGVDRVGTNDSFFELGGDSLTAVQMAAKVRERYGAALNLRNLFNAPTIAALTQMIGTKSQAPATSEPLNLNDGELVAEAFLPADIAPDPNAEGPVLPPYRNILLTGGTGYTGAYLLRELLNRSTAKIHVLVRAKDATEALDRIRQNMTHYSLWRESERDRLMSVPGDIGRPYFNVTRETYKELASCVDIIIHNAAVSNYALPYRQLKPSNVLGTQEILRLACRQRIKPVHYVSSVAVFPGHKGVHHIREVEVEEPGGLAGGYRQSKWVSEKLICAARRRGIPSCIYRPGQITGAQDTGACSTDTFLNAAIKGCIQLKAEMEFDVRLEITPVDFCAAAIAHIALSGSRHGSQFHLSGTRPIHWNDVCEMVRRHGYPLRRLPYRDWYRELSAALEQGHENALAKFFPLFGEESPSAGAGEEGNESFFDRENLLSAVTGQVIECRSLDQELMSLYLDYFIATGFLPSPQGTIE